MGSFKGECAASMLPLSLTTAGWYILTGLKIPGYSFLLALLPILLSCVSQEQAGEQQHNGLARRVFKSYGGAAKACPLAWNRIAAWVWVRTTLEIFFGLYILSR